MSRGVVMFKETRTFDQSAKRHRCFQTAICSQCASFENHPVNGVSPMPPEPLIKMFQRRGWVMGSSRAHDMCPACVKDAAKSKRREAATPRSKLLSGTAHEPTQAGARPNIPFSVTLEEAASAIRIASAKESPQMLKAVETAAPQPRQPSREDKRLVILEIENHYLGPDKGYSNGSTDETVAKSLNVPVKWVADLREEFFGPLVNPEYAKLSAELGQLTSRFDAHEREGRELRAKLMDLKGRISKVGGGQ